MEHENTSGNAFLCGTVILDSSGDSLAAQIANNVYNQCRAGTLEFQGFPNFQPLVASLKEGPPVSALKDFKVCSRADATVVW